MGCVGKSGAILPGGAGAYGTPPRRIVGGGTVRWRAIPRRTVFRSSAPRRALLWGMLLAGCLLGAVPGGSPVAAPVAAPSTPPAVDLPPLKVSIQDAQGRAVGQANVYLNYVELLDAAGHGKGAIGVVQAEGRERLFLVRADGERKLIGWAEERRLYNAEGKLVGFYGWTPIWSYVYDAQHKKVGQAQCLAYQGVCAAGIAGYLLGLF